MKSVWLTIVIGLALGQGVLAQAGVDDIEYGRSNGLYWQSLRREMRIVYVVGYVDGASTSVIRSQPDPTAISRAAVDKAVEKLLPVMSSVEIVSAVDRFYREPLNRRILISDAIRVVALEDRGADRATVHEEILRLRLIAAFREKPAANPPGRVPTK
jgi:hypothetical protein